MKVESITNTRFGAKTIRVNASENKNISSLYKKIMDLTSVNSEYRSGQVIYRMGRENNIDIHDPKAGFKEFLEKIGIKFNEISE